MTPADNALSIRPVDHWKVEVVRATFFPPTLPTSVAPGLWAEVTGEQPDEQTLSPKQGLCVEQGQYLGGVFITDQRPDRRDLLLVANPPGDATIAPALGTFDEVVTPFTETVGHWIKKAAPNVVRVAFGVTVHLPTSSRDDGYRQLAPYLPFAPDPASSDLIYQINRRRPSGVVPGLQVNRLSKWTVVLWRTTYHQNGANIPGPTADSGCRVELDINTVPEYREVLPSPGVTVLFQDFVKMAREILERGDVK